MKYLVLLLLVACSPTFSDRVTTGEDVVNHVNVRDAEQNGNAIAELRPGEFADLLSTETHHHLIRLSDGTEGFVSRRWTRIVPDPVPPAPPSGELSLHFIDVGQGDSTLIICPDNSTILVDSGSNSGMQPGPVRDYITEVIGANVDRIDHLIVTHPDGDHYNLLPDVLRGFAIGHAYYVGYKNNYNDPDFWDWLEAIPDNRRTRMIDTYLNPPNAPHPLMDCGDADVFVLAAATKSSSSWKNALSIVILVKYGDFEAILTGDATHDTENVVMARFPAAFLDVDVLKIGHHGSLATSTSKKWADTLKPPIAVVSAGERSQYGHPRKEVIERLEPHTLNDSGLSHPISYSVRLKEEKKYQWTDLDDYDELIFSTVNSGNIIIRSDGSDTPTIESVLHGTF